MRSAEPRHVIVVNAGTADATALAATLDSVLAASAAPVLVAGAALPAAFADQPRLRQLPPLAGLAELARALPPEYAEVDVAWVAAGVRVPAGWDARLAILAAAEASLGSVSPLCDAAPLLALAPEGEGDPVRLDRLAHALGVGRPVQLPVFLEGCVYLRRAALAALEGVTGDAWTLARTIERAGLVDVACDQVLVEDSDARRRAAYAALAGHASVAAMLRAHPLAGLRHAVADALRQGLEPAPAKPVQLHIAHSWGGGLGRWVEDYGRGDTERNNLVLKSIGIWGAFGQRLGLYTSYHAAAPLRVWELRYPIHATALAHLEYRAVLREIVADYGVEAVLVSSLIGHALDALATGLPTVLVAHDHYPFCVAIYAYFDEPCDTCDGARLRRCLAGNPHHTFFRGVEPEDWEALRHHFVRTVLEHEVALIAPSPSVVQRWRSHMPELAARPFKVIAHGVELASTAPTVGNDDDGRLRIVMLGSLAPVKGLALLEQGLPELLQLAELHLLGCGEHGERLCRPGVHVVPVYEHAALPGLLAAARPHLGLQLSLVPETFSYTLSELWHFGVPVLVTRVGSLADRIEDGVNGFVCEPDAASLVARLRWIAAHRDALAAARAAIATQPARTLADMVRDYHALMPLPPVRGHCAAQPALPALTPVLAVDPAVPFGVVLRAFAGYVQDKLESSPRLRPWLRRVLVGCLRLLLGQRRRTHRLK